MEERVFECVCVCEKEREREEEEEEKSRWERAGERVSKIKKLRETMN